MSIDEAIDTVKRIPQCDWTDLSVRQEKALDIVVEYAASARKVLKDVIIADD